jgi:hypothetical protein
VLIGTSAIETIDAPEKTIFVNLTRDQIERSPSVDSAEIELVETLPSFVIF